MRGVFGVVPGVVVPGVVRRRPTPIRRVRVHVEVGVRGIVLRISLKASAGISYKDVAPMATSVGSHIRPNRSMVQVQTSLPAAVPVAGHISGVRILESAVPVTITVVGFGFSVQAFRVYYHRTRGVDSFSQ